MTTNESTWTVPDRTVGLDLADRFTELCALDAAGEVVERGRVRTTEDAFRRRFDGAASARIALEVGAHSPWVSRILRELDHEVIVANPRKLRLIYENDRKRDRADAEYLARVGRMDPELLAPVNHRGEQVQADRALFRARDQLVRIRTRLISHVRGSVKSWGKRLPSCSTMAFPGKVSEEIPEPLRPGLGPVVEQIDELNGRIRRFDDEIERLSAERYPETELLQQVDGVGPKCSLCYVLTIEDPTRFRKSRTVGAYLGLVPRQSDSGETERRGRITKSGDALCRRLLIQSAHYILGPFGTDSDLRRWGQKLEEEGGNGGRKRAAVALARKLAVLLHRLWVTGEVYEPLHQATQDDEAEAA